MRTGEAYLYSEQKARLDQFIAASLKPIYLAARLGAAASFGLTLHVDQRVGRSGEIVDIPKIKTLADDETPLSPLAESYRRKGLDELPQLELVQSGIMSIIGTRHLLPDEYDMLRDIAQRSNDTRELLEIHDEVVMPAKRGLLSSFALHAHISGEADVRRRLSLDVADHLNASLSSDLKLIGRTFRSASLNELTNGINHISDTDSKSV